MITNRTYGMDPDVIAYNARIVAGGNQSLSMQSLRQLNQFVISIKKMKLWHNMVCWPLRANQNAGGGLTAYSLGGLGTFDGTLTNGPTWSVNGIIFTSSSNQQITTTLNSSGSSLTHMACVIPVWLANAMPTSSESGTRKMSLRLVAIDSAGINYFNSGSSSVNLFNSMVDQQPMLLTASFRNNEVNLSSNTITNTSSVTATISTGNGGFVIGARNFIGGGDQFYNGRIAFASFGNIFLTLSQQSTLYSIYKTTLGQDLGLP